MIVGGRLQVLGAERLFQQIVRLHGEDGGEVAVLNEVRQLRMALGGPGVGELSAQQLAAAIVLGHLAGELRQRSRPAAVHRQILEGLAHLLPRQILENLLPGQLTGGDMNGAASEEHVPT